MMFAFAHLRDVVVGATRWVALRYVAPMIILAIMLGFVLSGTIHAQRTVTQDDVNAVAERMYCPICENIPLDDCGTTTCQAWKEEIRTQLMAGQSAEAIIDDFVRRYGEQVVGIPQNPVLRALSLVTPWLMVGIALLIGVWTFRRWQVRPTDPEAPVLSDIQSDTYRDRIEQDVG
jgi:cytochrome c-type biogenesis protein CcmH